MLLFGSRIHSIQIRIFRFGLQIHWFPVLEPSFRTSNPVVAYPYALDSDLDHSLAKTEIPDSKAEMRENLAESSEYVYATHWV